MAGISWIASRSLAMTGWGGRSLAMTGGVIASGSDAIQLVVQEEAGLPRRFAPRNDGWGLGAFRQSLAGSLHVRSR